MQDILGVAETENFDSAKPAERRSVKSMKRFLRSMLIIYTLVIILLGFFQRKLLYHPVKTGPLSVAAFRQVTELYPAAKDINLKCADGVSIKGWLLQRVAAKNSSESGGRPLVIYFHGNAGNRAGRIPWYLVIANAGADILAIDYHGYADSEGTMTESGLEMDCDAAWDYATKTLSYQPDEIIIAGTSLGGAAAVYLASKQCAEQCVPSGMFVASTFSSMVDVGGSLYPWLPVGAVLVDRYPSDQRIKNVACPVMMMHGDRDRLVLQKLGKKLFDAVPATSEAGVAKKWVNLPGIGHNDLMSNGVLPIQKEVLAFITSLRK